MKGGRLQIQEYLAGHKNKEVAVTVERDSGFVTLHPVIDSLGRIGVLTDIALANYIPITQKKYSLGQAALGGIEKAGTTLSNYVKELKLMFAPDTEAYKSVGSFITMGSIFPSAWNWMIFWNTAITVDRAAKVIKRKKRLPHSLPPGISRNTLGRVTNTSPGPSPGLTPKAKQAGKMIKPDKTATQVSKTRMLTASPARLRSFPI